MTAVTLLLCLLISGNCLSLKYVPGTSGADWTLQEVLAVKSKLYAVFSLNGGYKAVQEIHGDNNGVNWMDVPDAAKMLRLGFHDCLKYKDGTGGCDGCLNWEGVGYRYGDGANKWKFDDVSETNNNGLGPTVEVLEKIYTDPHFPLGKAPSLPQSLRDSGKSRADLWALATITATEFAAETNNMVCDGTYQNNPRKQCSHHPKGAEDCYSRLTSPIKFYTGRKDCATSFKTTKKESHPSAVGNGRMTADFFMENFGFTGRETVAIMGAHTVGRLHYPISLFRYLWTTRTEGSLNNDYYKNIVREDRFAFHDDQCNLITDAEGNTPKTRWAAHIRKDTKSGGPVHWIHENYQCPNCFKNQNDPCCQNVQAGHFCNADGDKDDDVNFGGCEKYRFISGLDEMALQCEIGLYFDFNVTTDGMPYGCPGMEFFNHDYFNKSYTMMWTTMPKAGKKGDNWWEREKADPNCPLNMLEYPAGSKPLSTIFHEFAASNQLWVDEFVLALEKMLSNGYDSSTDLKLGPDQYSNVKCPYRPNPWDSNRYTNCYLDNEIKEKEPFYLISRYDGRALRAKGDGFAEMVTIKENDQKQLWVTSDYGDQLVNVANNLPLQAGNGRTWRYSPTDLKLIDARTPNKVLTRGWGKVEGAHAVTWNKTPGLIVQQFIKQTRRDRNISDTDTFMIASRLDRRVMQGMTNGEAQMMEQNSAVAAQLWIRYTTGEAVKFVNVQTKLPLYVGTNNEWTYDDHNRIVEVKNNKKALDRGWGRKNGDLVIMWDKHQGPNQKFDFVQILM